MKFSIKKIVEIVVLGIYLFSIIQCKKENELVNNDLKNQDSILQQKRKDSLQQDSIKKEQEMIKYSSLVFPKDKKDSVMAKFLENYDENERHIILALNRLDNKNRWRADTLIIPNKIDSDFLKYTPFPLRLDSLKRVKKIAFFSYNIHAYALYENGNLIKWGPSSMGKKATPTRTGLMFTNWKKEIAISTSNSEWKLRWNFNIHNKDGIGWHQYDLPGFHASHACLRLLEEDAQWMYNWADQWILTNHGQTIEAKGTPVIVFGESDFETKPWLKLLANPKSNNYSEEEINAVFLPFLREILLEQRNSESIKAMRESASTLMEKETA